MAKKKNDLLKDTMSLGIGSMAGMGAMGAMGSIPGMPGGAGATIGTVGAGMNMLNIGQMSKNAMSITGAFGNNSVTKKKKK